MPIANIKEGTMFLTAATDVLNEVIDAVNAGGGGGGGVDLTPRVVALETSSNLYLARIGALETDLAEALARIAALETPTP